jgi:hypothetical protein
MKVKVFADPSGKILATSRSATGSKSAPTHMRLEVAGAHEHELEIPDELLTPQSVHKLHTEHRVDLTGPSPRLIHFR